MTNFQRLSRSRKKQVPGDVFAMLLPDERYLFGRVISTDAVIFSMVGVLLLYVYRYRSDSPDVPDRSELRADRLLVPPMMTNRKGWTEGVFETVGNVPLDVGDVLDQHCFLRSAVDFLPSGDTYFDEVSNQLPGPVEPVGVWGLRSFRTIDNEISDALGFDRVPDPDAA